MPNITYYEALSSKIMTQIFDNNTFRLHTMKAEVMTYRDADGNVVRLEGTDFKYTANGEVKGGTVSSVIIRDGDGHLLQTVKDINPGDTTADPEVPADTASDAEYLYSYFKNDRASALSFLFNSDRDHLFGSRKADIMDGGDRADYIFGGAGNDILTGGAGMDHLTGGGGKDLFYFKQGDGRDIVTDFHDSGRNHDQILISKNQYAILEKHQSGHDVILDFGWGDQLILEHMQASHIGKDDFQLY